MTNIVPIKNTKLRPLRALKKFIEDADLIVACQEELEGLLDKTKQAAGRAKDADEVAALFAYAKRVAASESDRQRLARCDKALEQFDPAGAYDDDNREEGLRRSVIGERLALLVGAFPNGTPADPTIYATALVEEICTIEYLTLPALDAAVWQIIGTMKFLPAVTEVVAEVTQQQKKWDDRVWAIDSVPRQSRRLLAQLDAMEIEAQAAAIARAEQKQAAEKARALEQARRAYTDAEDALSDARRELAEKQEEVDAARDRLLECQSELARAEAAAHNEIE